MEDTSPLVPTTRHKRNIRIEERNIPASPSIFDVTVNYPSDRLPEWFKDLQSVLEDDTFTNMVINLGNRTFYHISDADQAIPEKPICPVDMEDGNLYTPLIAALSALWQAGKHDQAIRCLVTAISNSGLQSYSEMVNYLRSHVDFKEL